MADDTGLHFTRLLPSGLRLRVFAAHGVAPAVACVGMTALFVRAGSLQMDADVVSAGHAWFGQGRQVSGHDLQETLDALLIDTPGCTRFNECLPGHAVLRPIDAESGVAIARILALSTQAAVANALGCHFEAMRLLTSPAACHGTAGAPDARVLRAAAIMRTRMQDPPSIEALAYEVGMSPAAFKRAFPRAFGCPPYAWLRRERLVEARRLIEQTSLPIAEIAYRVGLAAGGHFAAACRELFGKEPRALREAVRDLHGAARNTVCTSRRQ